LMTNGGLTLVNFSRRTQWHYVTANSCSPPGYHSYFQGGNSQGTVLRAELWADKVSPCPNPLPQFPQDGVLPEQFWNCAEGTCMRPFVVTLFRNNLGS
jgi:hypothetical protein